MALIVSCYRKIKNEEKDFKENRLLHPRLYTKKRMRENAKLHRLNLRRVVYPNAGTLHSAQALLVRDLRERFAAIAASANGLARTGPDRLRKYFLQIDKRATEKLNKPERYEARLEFLLAIEVSGDGGGE